MNSTNAATLINNVSKEDELMAKVNSLPKMTITIIKYVAALSTKIKTHAALEPYITPLLQLLTFLINIRRDPVLTTIKSKLELLLTTYVFYIDELLKDQLDIESYTEKHDQLVYFNTVVKDCVRNGNCAELYGLFV